MSPTPTPPDLTKYRQLHLAMRIADDRLVAGIESLAEGDHDRAAALRDWYVGYAGELRAHHRIEDHIIFPAVQARVPAYAQYSATLADDHEHLDDVIERLTASLTALVSVVDGWREQRTTAVALATELRDLLVDHLDVEDNDVLPMIERHFSAAEYEQLDTAAMKAMSIRQMRFTLPWWMATVPPEIAAHELANAPLMLKVVWYATRRRYARLEAKALGTAPALRSA